jgi:hypothetical protein
VAKTARRVVAKVAKVTLAIIDIRLATVRTNVSRKFEIQKYAKRVRNLVMSQPIAFTIHRARTSKVTEMRLLRRSRRL